MSNSMNLWTWASQAHLFQGISRQENWRLPFLLEGIWLMRSNPCLIMFPCWRQVFTTSTNWGSHMGAWPPLIAESLPGNIYKEPSKVMPRLGGGWPANSLLPQESYTGWLVERHTKCQHPLVSFVTEVLRPDWEHRRKDAWVWALKEQAGRMGCGKEKPYPGQKEQRVENGRRGFLRCLMRKPPEWRQKL